jgi:GNAT superfamily N-acetyltransferase
MTRNSLAHSIHCPDPLIPDNTSKEKFPPPILRPVTARDIPALASIGVSSTRHELLFSSPLFWATPKVHYNYLVTFLTTRLPLSSWQFIKALDPTTQQIIGWGASNIYESNWADTPNDFDTSKLSGFLNDKYMSIQRDWFTGRRFLYLAALFTELEFQGKGVGTSIIEALHERADQERLMSYLQGTAVATPFYMQRGWKAVERFEVDLKAWVKGDLGYGVYKVGYMVRLPVESRQGDSNGGNEGNESNKVQC